MKTLDDLITGPAGDAKELAKKAARYKVQLSRGQITQRDYDRLLGDLRSQADQYRMAAEEERRNAEAQALQLLISLIASKVI